MDPTRRRPLKTRKLPASKRLARLVGGTGLTPNAISLFGLGFGLLGGSCFAATSLWPGFAAWLWFGGAACIQLRLLANMLDGMVAEETGKSSPVGELYNEVPDRFADIALLVGFGFAEGGGPYLGFIAAGLAVLTAYIRQVGAALGHGHDFRGPFAKPQRMFVATVGALVCGGWTFLTGEPGTLFGKAIPLLVLALLAIGTGWTVLRRLGHLYRALLAVKS